MYKGENNAQSSLYASQGQAPVIGETGTILGDEWPSEKNSAFIAVVFVAISLPAIMSGVFLAINGINDHIQTYIWLGILGFDVILFPLVGWYLPSRFSFEADKLKIINLFGFSCYTIPYSIIKAVYTCSGAGFVGTKFATTFAIADGGVALILSGRCFNVLVTPVNPSDFVDKIQTIISRHSSNATYVANSDQSTSYQSLGV